MLLYPPPYLWQPVFSLNLTYASFFFSILRLFFQLSGLPSYISSIVGIDPSGNRYARTKHGSYLLLKQHVSHEWLSISNNEWSRQKARGDLTLSVNLPTIIPNKIGHKYHWNLKTNHTITGMQQFCFVLLRIKGQLYYMLVLIQLGSNIYLEIFLYSS